MTLFNGGHVCSESQSGSKQARVIGESNHDPLVCGVLCLRVTLRVVLCVMLFVGVHVVAVAVVVVVVCVCAVWRVWCGTLKNPVCRFKTSPCVPAPRARDETHVRVVPVRTHGGGFNVHTVPRPPPPLHPFPTHTDQTQHQRNITLRQTERERARRQRKREETEKEREQRRREGGREKKK